MAYLQRKYVHSHKNFTAYFIVHDPFQNEEIKIADDFIYVKGEEKLLNITDKTLKSIKYLLKDKGLDFNFVIRTNLSTVINLYELDIFLNSIPPKEIYCGGNVTTLNWLDPPSGIVDTTFFGTQYVQGTSIILSHDVALHCVEHMNMFNIRVVDDVSFGLYMKYYFPEALPALSLYNASICINRKNSDNQTCRYCFFRNVTEDRLEDLKNMKSEIECIYKIKIKNYFIYLFIYRIINNFIHKILSTIGQFLRVRAPRIHKF